ncbi:uncharacterized protein LOC131149868 [Malania oleifera]|uniref:uncharacterized protein LOC131149868 n=1 Tax=Malania oleifera TaxID=397392 RepID=UPI0025AEA832|nr:uncharacterized protein LOC131149868 [Malania oleifera]
MSQTMSGLGDWLHYYPPTTSFPAQPLPPRDSRPPQTMLGDRVVSDATVVTTTITSSVNSGAAAHLNAEGRVSKPVRRRSRASRRTPTTLLNTDTTNFRAMVQQFTGGPCGPFSSSPASGGLNFNFGIGGAHLHRQQNYVNHPGGGAVLFPAAVGGSHQHQQQQQLQLQYFQAHHDHDQRPAGSSVPREGMGVSDGLIGEGGVPSQVPYRPARGSVAGRPGANGYMF